MMVAWEAVPHIDQVRKTRTGCCYKANIGYCEATLRLRCHKQVIFKEIMVVWAGEKDDAGLAGGAAHATT